MPVSLALVAAALVVGIDTYIVAAGIPAISDDLHEPVEAVGLVASAYALPTALFAPIFGPFSDRRGRRVALLLGLAIFVVAAAGCVVAPSLPLLILARAVNGLGAAIVLPAAFAYAADEPEPSRRARMIGVVSSAFPLATLVGLPIGAVITGTVGWRGTFAFVVLGAAAAAALVARLPRDRGRSGVGAGYLASYRAVLTDPSALAVLAVTLVWFTGSMGLFPYMGEFFHVSFGIPASQAGLAYLVIGLVGVAASRLSGRLISTIGAKRAVLIAISAFAIGTFLLPLTVVALPLALVAFAVWAFGTWFGVPASQVIIASLSDRLRATVLAFNGSAVSLGGVIGPAVTGQVLAGAGFAAAARWTSLLAVAALVLALVVLPRERAAAATAPIIEHA